MQTLKNIKEGDTLTDFRGDEMYVDTIGTIEINDEYNTALEEGGQYEYKEMLEVASHEHAFANMQLGLMLAALEEIKEVTEEPIVDMIIENVLERRAIDIAIHSKKILNDKD